jgi:hypothetical protein
MMKAYFNSILVFLPIIFISCSPKESINDNLETSIDTSSFAQSRTHESTLDELANEYLTYLSQSDFLALAELNGSAKVLFSPYLFVDTTSALKFSFQEMLALAGADVSNKWGLYDGSGEPIFLNIQNYFARFVNDVNYLDDTAEINLGEVQQRGNSLSNLTELFPDAEFVEFYKGPVDDELMGMDWRSLILVFQLVHDEIKLVAIVHNEWTI